MKVPLVIALGAAAVMMVACGKSEETSKSEQSMTDKPKQTAMQAKDTPAQQSTDTQKTMTEKAETAAETAAAMAQEGASKVAEEAGEAKAVVAEKMETAKEVVTEKVEAVKESVQEKAGSLMDKESTAAAMAGDQQVSAAPAPKADTSGGYDLAMGKSVYSGKCSVCHTAGVAGAPKLDDASWAQRKAQGMDVMIKHAINGYQGANGYMPAKGGYTALSDQEVAAAVAYMASQSK